MCEPGSVVVEELLEVETYSHVLHLVSSVSGTLPPGVGALEALRAALPAGTLSGALKVRAMAGCADQRETSFEHQASALRDPAKLPHNPECSNPIVPANGNCTPIHMLTETQVRTWIDDTLGGETGAMSAVRSRTDVLGLAHEEMGPSQVMLLRTLMLALRAREVLELGTFLGHGAASFVETLDALGGGRLTTVDHDATLSNDAKTNFPVASRATTIDFLVGEADAVCAELLDAGRTFDLILLDIAEKQYPDLYDPCVALLRPSGLLAVDNAMMATVQGWESSENVVEAQQSDTMRAIGDLVAKAGRDQRVWASLVPLASGLLLCAKR